MVKEQRVKWSRKGSGRVVDGWPSSKGGIDSIGLMWVGQRGISTLLDLIITSPPQYPLLCLRAPALLTQCPSTAVTASLSLPENCWVDQQSDIRYALCTVGHSHQLSHNEWHGCIYSLSFSFPSVLGILIVFLDLYLVSSHGCTWGPYVYKSQQLVLLREYDI